MKTSSNPLDKISIASPCAANWNEMYGSQRRRFCSLCRLNVYNLSDMTQAEAERFLLNSEGRVCLRVFRRADGTVLTQDCPVGWQKIKRKVSYTAVAFFTLAVTFFGGILGLKTVNFFRLLNTHKENSKPSQKLNEEVSFGLYGALGNLPEIKAEILRNVNK